jgi:hypothetical protein
MKMNAKDFARKRKLGLRMNTGGFVEEMEMGDPAALAQAVGESEGMRNKLMAKAGVRTGFAEGGPVRNRAAMIDEQASAGVRAPVVVAAPAPAPAPAAPVQMSPEEIAIRQKHGMAVPGQAKPSMFQSLRKKVGFADGGPVGLRQISMRDQPLPPRPEVNALEMAAAFVKNTISPPKPGRQSMGPVSGKAVPHTGEPIRTSEPITGVRGATGGETGNMVKDAKRRLGLRRGGKVTGPGGPEEDKIDARLSNGEYVLPAKTTATIGVPVLDEIVRATNDGKEPAGSFRTGMATGGEYWDRAKRAMRGAVDGAREGLRTTAVPGTEIPVTPAPAGPAPMPQSVQLEDASNPVSRRTTRSFNPAGGVIEVTPGGTATTEAQRTQILMSEAERQPKFEPKGARGLRVAGRALAGVGPALEAYDVAKVANDPASTGLDVAGQAASGVARSAGAVVGGTAGATIGTGVMPGLGTAAGAVIGGGLGYLLPDYAIKAGRYLAGSDTADPVNRGAQPPVVTAEQSTAASQPQPGRVIDPRSGQVITAADVNNPNNTVRGFSYAQPAAAPAAAAPVAQQMPRGLRNPTQRIFLPEEQADPREAALLAAIDKATSRNPAEGAGDNFYTGNYAGNVAGVLQDRARAKLLMKKYGTDESSKSSRRTNQTSLATNYLSNKTSRENNIDSNITSTRNNELDNETSRSNNAATNATSAANNQRTIAQQQAAQAQANAKDGYAQVNEAFDRMTTVDTVDPKTGKRSSAVDTKLRNEMEAYARNSVKGWNDLTPEQRMQAMEGKVRQGFMLQKLSQSTEGRNLAGRLLTTVGLKSQLGDETSTPVGVKAIRTTGIGDLLTEKDASLWGGVTRAPYVEFDNGRLAPLSAIANSPELRSAFERRIAATADPKKRAELQKQLSKAMN